jgi:hypothetical protein
MDIGLIIGKLFVYVLFGVFPALIILPSVCWILNLEVEDFPKFVLILLFMFFGWVLDLVFVIL